MCGIGLIVAGVPIRGHFAPGEAEASGLSCQGSLESAETVGPSYEDLCNVLKRRGPDHIGGQVLHLSPQSQNLEKTETTKPPHPTISNESPTETLTDRASNAEKSPPIATPEGDIAVDLGRCGLLESTCSARLQFVGATLQLRGDHPVQQPLLDSVGNVLVYNGEVFDGLKVRPSENDTEVIMQALCDCCSCACHSHSQRHQHQLTECACSDSGRPHQTVPRLLSQLRGPWALIFWQAVSRTLWFGRDAIGRRSLLIHKPTPGDPRLLLTSVAPERTKHEGQEAHDDPVHMSSYWDDLTCGIHSITYQSRWKDESMEQNLTPASCLREEPGTGTIKSGEYLEGWARVHDWHDPLLKSLLAWERALVTPTKELKRHHHTGSDQESPAKRILEALCRAVKRRTECIRIPKKELSHSVNSRASSTLVDARSEQFPPLAVLFSGGVDSMILAAIADQFVDPDASIDLLNVSFEGDLAPDRVTAISGLSELEERFPLRRWRLIKIDAKLSDLTSQRGHVLSLICPSNTYMDINIGTALWLAASGVGYVHESPSQRCQGQESEAKPVQSEARVLLVGSGADEQCGGYGRHRTKFRQGGWEMLDAEMRLDFNRIWKRNLGRDDRCLSDRGKEARFPFLDEDVVAALLSLPLWDVVNMEEPAGCGEKKVLRQVARLLGLKSASSLPKRAIQFGSRIARESNRKDFGSNRAANLANAGTVVLKEFASS
ncbi:hypothetical protein Mapa_006884 [Marchantia paleacea]|nr:hypothetical protein Mapa_006884 [Marchantia paleacea]